MSDYRDWRDFVDRVARPLVDDDGVPDALLTELPDLGVSPYYLLVALVMADNALDRWVDLDD